MTLVAAIRVGGVPVLLGDTLITAGDKQRARRKLHRISNNLVIGWTGHEIAAGLVIDALLHRFRDAQVSYGDVEAFFLHFRVKQLKPMTVHIIGWVMDPEPHCFRWNSDWPAEMFLEVEHIGGSGSSRSRRRS
jgi:hypothetical protein